MKREILDCNFWSSVINYEMKVVVKRLFMGYFCKHYLAGYKLAC